MRWCQTELPNLVAATQQAADMDESTIAWQLPAVIWDFLSGRRRWVEWLATHHTGLAAARRAHDRTGEGWMLNMLGPAYRDLRRFDEAVDCLQQALAIWREAGNRDLEGWTLYNLGDTYRLVGRFDEALDHLLLALARSREAGVRWGEGWVLNMLGDTYRELDRYDEAFATLQEALTIRREVGDHIGYCWTLHLLGRTCLDRGRFEEGIAFLRRSLATSREHNLRWLSGHDLLLIGDAMRDIGQPHEARESWRQALTIFEDIDDARADEARDRLLSPSSRSGHVPGP
jgi:tetratricopeptide (TPR) repeat protein